MIKIILRLLPALTALLLPRVASSGPVTAEYTIHVDDLASRLLCISASITVRDSTLEMRRSVWSRHLPDGWATWVGQVEVATSDGTGGAWRPLTYLGGAVWDASQLVDRRVQLRYTVRLEHEQVEWPYGLKESTYVTDDMIHAVGMSLFLFTPSVGDFRVEFDIPDDWRVLAPWDRVGGSELTYAGSGPWQLVHSVIAFGTMPSHRIRIGEAEVQMALSGDLARDSASVAWLLAGVAAEAERVFRAAPPGTFTVVVGRGSDSGGGAFYRGFSMMTGSGLRPRAMGWQRTLAHELIHLWIGANSIRTVGPEEEWFKEGFTSYYTALLLARAGLIDRDSFLDELYRLWRMHRAEEGPPLDEAGREERRWYDHVYGGGAVLAACLDVRLRSRSSGAVTLDDLMAALYRRVAGTGEALNSEAIVASAANLDGAEIGAWIHRSLRRPDQMRADACWTWLGLREGGFPWDRGLRVAGESSRRLDRLLSPRGKGYERTPARE